MATAPPDHPFATRDDLRRLELLIEQMRHDLDVQFTRIAQLQADLDLIRGAWAKVKPADAPYIGPERRGKSR
jgi:hypothetical protein